MTDSVGAGRKILLVEDNLDNQAVYRLILEHSGFQVILTERGDEAVEIARSELPDLILMDISIPGMDGWEATRILKGDDGTAHIPVIALTAHAFEKDRERAEELGCDGYMAKPIEPRRALAVVVEVLEKTGRA